MAGRRVAGSAAVLKAKKERKYGMTRKLRTEENRKRKQRKHIREHPNDIQNNIRGMEHIRKNLG